MQKFFLTILLIINLSACTFIQEDKADDSQRRYLNMAALALSYENLKDSSDYFDLSGEVVKIENGYRYYVFLDNPRVALYNIRIIAIEDNSDYEHNMAANAGIFENEKYIMIPNQSNAQKGYVAGIAISGTSSNSDISLRVLVQWENRDTVSNRECYRLELKYEQ